MAIPLHCKENGVLPKWKVFSMVQSVPELLDHQILAFSFDMDILVPSSDMAIPHQLLLVPLRNAFWVHVAPESLDCQRLPAFST